MDATPLLAINQVRTKLKPPMQSATHPPRCGVRQQSTLALGLNL